MSTDPPIPPVRSAGIVLPCDDLDATMTFFTDLGFELRAIAPPDDPTRATLVGFGLRLHLEPDLDIDPGILRLSCDHAAVGGRDVRTAPNGTRVELVTDSASVPIPTGHSRYGISRAADATWTTGRAEMRYRDLVPDRAGDALVASLIHIEAGGPVADYVHFHHVAFQLIYCASGWVEVVYEDQGAPFVLEQGDAVLQPPGIRHQVRESSDDLVVIEVTVPADHDTMADPETELPNEAFRPSRRFGGQRFTRHIAGRSIWVPWNANADFEGQRLRIDVPTNHLAGAWTVRAKHDGAESLVPGSPAVTLLTVLDGEADLDCADEPPTRLQVADAAVIPPQRSYRLQADDQFEMLVVTLNLPDGQSS
ncbi:MAG: cupin domain-containing protein [Acidimicrobiales bacterium]